MCSASAAVPWRAEMQKRSGLEAAARRRARSRGRALVGIGELEFRQLVSPWGYTVCTSSVVDAQHLLPSGVWVHAMQEAPL